MKGRGRLWLAGLALLTGGVLTLPAPLGSQSSGDSPARPVPPAARLRVDVDLVLVPVTVTDPYNRLVTGLDKEHFEVFEGKEKQEILTFSSEDAPLSLGLVFDVSGSMNWSNKLARAREAAVQFFKTANPQDEFFLIEFADRPHLLADYTSAVEELQNRMLYTQADGNTALLDAIYLALHNMEVAHNPKKALLIISDGGDNKSRYNLRDIKAYVREADAQIYAIGIFDPDRGDRGAEYALGPGLLDDLAQMTGGRMFPVEVHALSDLPDVAAKISVELRNQYVLGFRSKNTARDGSWRKIKVKLAPPPGLPPLNVYSRSGYYAPSH